MTMTSGAGSGAAILRPEQVGDLLIQPVSTESVAVQASTLVQTESHSYRIPLVTADPTAAWVAEGAEIAVSDATLAELTVTPTKLAGLTIISRELANDTSPEAAETVGAGLARDLARKLDEAFFGAMTAPAAAGLGSLASPNAVDAGTAWANTDPFVEATSAAEQLGATLTSFVANPADALALAKLRDETGSNRPLLGVDPTQPTRRVVAGVPLLVSPHVTAGTVWGLPQARVVVVIREPAEIETDSSPFFTSDRVAVRAILRVGFGFPHEAAVVKITLSAA